MARKSSASLRPLLVVVVSLAVESLCMADTKPPPGLAGVYVCKVDCHPSDAPPHIEIAGPVAVCGDDLGGVFRGKVLSPETVWCFNMTGTLSADGSRITWSNGGVWQRR